MADVFNIAGEINSTSQEGTAVHANQVKDDLQNKKQAQINEEVGEELALHTNRLNALTGQNYVTVVATQSTTVADIPTLINASGEGEQADTLYRVGFWDGSAYVADKYTEYAWNGTAYVILDVKSSIGEVFDISQYNAVGGTLATYDDLATALGASGANVPSSVRRGGMSIKFVQSSDNNYVQYRYMGTAVTGTPNPFLDTANWQGVDEEPTAGSHNLVESGGIPVKYEEKIPFFSSFPDSISETEKNELKCAFIGLYIVRKDGSPISNTAVVTLSKIRNNYNSRYEAVFDITDGSDVASITFININTDGKYQVNEYTILSSNYIAYLVCDYEKLSFTSKDYADGSRPVITNSCLKVGSCPRIFEFVNSENSNILNRVLVCDTAANTYNKSVYDVPRFVLGVNNILKIKMTNGNVSATNNTLSINNTGDIPLYFNGNPANSGNTWEAGDVLNVRYNSTTNRYESFLSDIIEKVVDLVPADGSHNLVESGGVASAIESVKQEVEEDIESLMEVVVAAKNKYQYSIIGAQSGIITTDGGVTQSYNGFYTASIPVKPNTFYYLSNRSSNAATAARILNTSNQKEKLLAINGVSYSNYYFPNTTGEGASQNGPFLTPSDAAYVEINLTPLNTSEIGEYYKIMLEEIGDTYDPEFTPSPWDDGIDKYAIKNDAIQKDSQVTEGSNKPVESGAVYQSIYKKEFKVLLVGSSHGVNTISMFPVLAKQAGINIVCGNLYTGSATIGFYNERPAAQIPFIAQTNSNFERFAVYENGGWTTKTTRSLKYALDNYKWDVIILQRGASENTVWNDVEANYYQNLLDYIKDNCNYNPRIYFSNGIANANNTADASSQINQTNQIVTSAKKMQSEFGIDIIPTAVAVQYARATCLHDVGVYTDMASDGQHLDTGIGQYVTGCTVFEKVVKDFFNLSIRELDYLPVYSDVSGNVVNSGSEYFTAITDYYSRIGKTVAALAVQDEEYKNDTATMLNSRYGSLPTSYTITNNLTGCSNINDAATIKSDEVYMTRLDVDSGKTMQSVVVTMGGEDITSSVYVATYTQGGVTYDYHAIRIGVITGNIVITAVAS